MVFVFSGVEGEESLQSDDYVERLEAVIPGTCSILRIVGTGKNCSENQISPHVSVTQLNPALFGLQM